MDWVASVISSLVWNSTENWRQSFRTLPFVCRLTQLKFNQRNWPQWDKSQKEQQRTTRMERNRVGRQWPGKDNAIPKAQFVVYQIRFWCDYCLARIFWPTVLHSEFRKLLRMFWKARKLWRQNLTITWQTSHIWMKQYQPERNHGSKTDNFKFEWYLELFECVADL